MDAKLQVYREQEEAIAKGIIFDPIETAGFIRERHSSVLSAILEIGAHLIGAKQNLAHGEYETWVKDHCGLSLRTARFYSKCARKGYHKRQEIASMRANAFASLMKLPDDIFSLALEEGELEGKPLEELTKREIEDYYEKLKADRDIERRKRMEAEKSIEEGTEQLSKAEKNIEELKSEIDKLKNPDYLSEIKIEEAFNLTSEIVLSVIRLTNIEVPSDVAGRMLSPLLVAVKGLEDDWRPKWEE